MMTMWKDEKGNWSLTKMETPICFGCIVGNGVPDERGNVVVAADRMQFTDYTRLEVQCSSCKRIMYREVS